METFVENQKVIDVTSLDVFGFKISRFKLQVLGIEHFVSMSEESPGVLVVGFNTGVPLSLEIDSNKETCLMRFVRYPGSATASPSEVEQVFGQPVDAEEYWRIVSQAQLVARTFLPGLTIYGPERCENGSRSPAVHVLSITNAPALSVV